MTNYEKIKAMSVEEMAKWFEYMPDDCSSCPAHVVCGVGLSCVDTLIKWLESEVEENG